MAVSHFAISREIIDHLDTLYKPEGISHQLSVWQAFEAVKYEGSNVNGFCTKYRNSLQSAASCGLAIPVDIALYSFISRISDHFENFTANVR